MEKEEKLNPKDPCSRGGKKIQKESSPSRRAQKEGVSPLRASRGERKRSWQTEEVVWKKKETPFLSATKRTPSSNHAIEKGGPTGGEKKEGKSEVKIREHLQKRTLSASLKEQSSVASV